VHRTGDKRGKCAFANTAFLRRKGDKQRFLFVSIFLKFKVYILLFSVLQACQRSADFLISYVLAG
jgi:hypothetical protein